ncbi:universal stress protein A [Tanacetum coccineum]
MENRVMMVRRRRGIRYTMKIWISVDESVGVSMLLMALETSLHANDATTTEVRSKPFHGNRFLFSTSGMRESVLKAEEESAAKILARAQELCDEHKIKAEYLVLKGNPKEILVEAVEQMDIELLVVGSRGLGQIKRAVLGSISDYCAHHAKCPVLIVRPPKGSQD